MLPGTSRRADPDGQLGARRLHREEVSDRESPRTALEMHRYEVPFIYPFGPEAVVDHYQKDFGPTLRSFERLSPAGRLALRQDLVQLWTEHNQAIDGSVCVESELLEVVAVKRMSSE